MDDHTDPYRDIEVAGLSVRLERSWHVLALRHFSSDGAFAQACGAWFKRALPATGGAVRVPVSPYAEAPILAWRNPTTTLVLSRTPATIEALDSALQGHPDGCCVDQSGGIQVLELTGSWVTPLLLRIGSRPEVVESGQVASIRIGEVVVTTLSVEPGCVFLLVDRAYLEHVLDWMRVTAAEADLSTSGAMKSI